MTPILPPIQMPKEDIIKAYEMLSMLHSETMLDNIGLREQLKISQKAYQKVIDDISGNWFAQLVYTIKMKLGLNKDMDY